jgi:hypothetical protein
MVSTTDTAMGILLGVSAFLLVLSLVSYRRSGVRSMLLLSEGLSVHVAFTVLLVSVAYATDWFEKVDGVLIVVVDAIVLAAVIVLGHFGGRPGAGPS